MRFWMMGVAGGLVLSGWAAHAQSTDFDPISGIPPNGLHPVFPDGYVCPPITSYFGSWLDVDGSERETVHAGIDLGNWGDAILAPADGHVVAAWATDVGYGPEWAVLILHTAQEMGLPGDRLIYSEFYHLDDEVAHLQTGQQVRRGEKLAVVRVPGGNRAYLPETHWDVYSIPADRLDDTYWFDFGDGHLSWGNDAEVLHDPLAFMPLSPDKRAQIVPFDAAKNYDGFVGFTYPLLCLRN